MPGILGCFEGRYVGCYAGLYARSYEGLYVGRYARALARQYLGLYVGRCVRCYFNFNFTDQFSIPIFNVNFKSRK
jgi:hypothetical protein